MDFKHTQNGNAFFLILIAVALFAALSYAVTNSTRSGGESSDSEELALQASQIFQYATFIENAMMRMRVSENCENDDMSFYMPGNANLVGYQHTPEASDTCKVFHPEGGGASWQEFPIEWFDEDMSGEGGFGKILFSNRTCVADVPSPDASTCNSDGIDNEELILVLPFLKSKALCTTINDALGVMPQGSNPPYDPSCGYIWNAFYDGTYSDGFAIQTKFDELNGQYSGCFAGNPTCPETYTYYHVLGAR